MVKSAGVPIHRLSDTRLVRRSQQGDRDAFLVFLQRYDHRLRGMAYALVTSSAVMDGVLRTAYLRAWREIVRVRPGEDPKGWLYRLAYNACIDELRREASRSSSRAPVDEDDPLAAALAALTPEQRVAVVLVDREGFAPEGAARIAGVDTATFAERLAVGRAALVETLPTAAPKRSGTTGATRSRTGGRRRSRPPTRPTPPQAMEAPEVPAAPAEAGASEAPDVDPDPTGAGDPPPPGGPPRHEAVAAVAAADGAKGTPGANGRRRSDGDDGGGSNGGGTPGEGSEGA